MEESTHLHLTDSHDPSRDRPVNIFNRLLSKVFHAHSHKSNFQLKPDESTEEGIRVVKLSFIALMITAVVQIFVVVYTQSVALLADTIHNFSDAFTSIPLWIAFVVSRRKKNSKYPYGYGRAEDLAGLLIVFMIAASAVLVFFESITRLINPIPPQNLFVLGLAAIIGYIGNELVARYRINVGRKINSEALIADGLHSKTDAYVSLSVLVGAIGAYLGFPILDPLIGIFIGILIVFVLRDATRRIWRRLMDSIDPSILTNIKHQVNHVEGVVKVTNVKARWVGRSLLAEVEIVVDRDFTVAESYDIEKAIEKKLINKIPIITQISIVDQPCTHHIEEIC